MSTRLERGACLNCRTRRASPARRAALPRHDARAYSDAMDLGLKGKVAIIAGASRGIGRATALVLAEEGCRLALAARGEERIKRSRGRNRSEERGSACRARRSHTA